MIVGTVRGDDAQVGKSGDDLADAALGNVVLYVGEGGAARVVVIIGYGLEGDVDVIVGALSPEIGEGLLPRFLEPA